MGPIVPVSAAARVGPGVVAATGVPGETSAGAVDADVDALERPDGFSASAQARILGEPVEDLSQRTESSRTLANPDGSWTTEELGGPAWVERDGQWLGVDLDLVARGDGSWAPRVGPVDVVVGAGDEVARVTFEDGTWVAVTWPLGDLPEPVV